MYQEVCFNRGTEAGGGVNVGHSLSPPSHFMLATGLPLLLNSAAKRQRKKAFHINLYIFSIAFFRATFLFLALLLTHSFV